MTRWDKEQKPDQRSKEHGKRDHGHGPKERGLGGKVRGPKPKVAASVTVVAAALYPSYFYVTNMPPVADQGSTPQCTAYSNAYDQNQHDRPETGRFWNFDEGAFFRAIGGDENGSYMDDALARRVAFGFPEQDSTPNPSAHRIRSFAVVPLSIEAIKAALSTKGADGRTHGVLTITEWAHSWFHPLASGKLPAWDYSVGYHATWWRGWNDRYGFRIRNSWGTSWGLSGDAFIPYAHVLAHVWGIWQTTDA